MEADYEEDQWQDQNDFKYEIQDDVNELYPSEKPS